MPFPAQAPTLPKPPPPSVDFFCFSVPFISFGMPFPQPTYFILVLCCFMSVSPPLPEGMWGGLSAASQTQPHAEYCYSLGCYSVALRLPASRAEESCPAQEYTSFNG